MTDAMLPHDDLATTLEACLALPGKAELLDPQWLLRAHDLLDTLKTPANFPWLPKPNHHHWKGFVRVAHKTQHRL
ncbi:MAG: hypothetical protein K8H75_10235 [Sulfuricella sp.]|nr:hypothetical protein [Sulfuricella sp.]